MERANENLSGDQVTSSVKSSGELLMPVEDHFKRGNNEEDKPVVVVVAKDTNDEQSVASRAGDKIKAFTKKFKFWSRIMDKSSDDGTANEGADDALSLPDEAPPNDEIEAILSTPKKTKQTAKQSSKKPSMETVLDKVTPVDHSSHDDHSELTDKKVVTGTTLEKKLPSAQATPDGDNVGQTITQELKNKSSRERSSADNSSIIPTALPVKQKPVVAVKPKPTSKPQPTLKPEPVAKPQAHIAPIQKEHSLTVESLVKQLEQTAKENDYYQLLGLEESASVEEIARCRREKSRKLHPDHFMTDALQKAK